MFSLKAYSASSLLTTRQINYFSRFLIPDCNFTFTGTLSERHLQSNKNQKPQDPAEIENMPTFDFAGKPKSYVNQKYRTDVFCWGFAGTGALGEESYLDIDPKSKYLNPPRAKNSLKFAPRRLGFVSSDIEVVDIAAGAGFTVMAATVQKAQYVLFGCGLNTDSQIGYQATNPGRPLVAVSNMVPILVPIQSGSANQGLPKEKITKVAAGRSHTVCLSNTGQSKSNELYCPLFVLLFSLCKKFFFIFCL